MMWNGMMSGWGGWLLTMLWLVFGVLLIVLAVLAAVWLARTLGSGGHRSRDAASSGSAPGTAREALDLRYARGEISRDEYLQARQDLEG